MTLNNNQKWTWKSIENLNLDTSVKKAYHDIISHKPIKQIDRKDKLIWAASNFGNYIVKEGYNAIICSQQWEAVNIPLNLCWDKSCLPKAGLFLWLAFQGKILTYDNLQKRGFSGPSRCILCKQESEDIDHLLYNCTYAKFCWEGININWNGMHLFQILLTIFF